MKKLLMLVAILMAAEFASAMNTHGGVQVKCKPGYQVYVGSNGHVSCIKSGTLGASNPILGPGGTQRLIGPGGTQNAQSRCLSSGGKWFAASQYCCPRGAIC